jgi:ABC-type transport system involved in multi-copper enzyme maturation permease subunit
VNSVLAIARYTVVEQIRNRLYLIILFFGGAIIAASLLLGALAPGNKIRVIFDLGLLAMELFGLTTAVFGAVTLILQEIESKTIYLILTRPLNRAHYIAGRFLGLITAVTLTMLAMAGLHLIVLTVDYHWFKEFTDTFSFWPVYPTLVFTSILKMLVTTAIAIFFSLIASSSVSALIFTAFFWVAGHFGPEITFLISKQLSGAAAFIAQIIAHVLPNFQYLNFRDTYAIPNFPGFSYLGWAVGYSCGYTLFFLALSAWLFSRKEF